MQTSSIEEPFRFTPTAHRSGETGDALERQTRQEISRLVSEMGELSRSELPARQFWLEFLGRMQRGMAAEGIVAWEMSIQATSPDTDPGGPTGTGLKARPNELGQSGTVGVSFLTEEERSVHHALLRDVVEHQRPILVPPHSLREEKVGNPTEFWIAIVPIEPGEGPVVLIETFLSDVGGPASQRGYLRFAAQMADLAGEYLRAAALRRLRFEKEFWEAWNLARTAIMGAEKLADVRRLLVDHAARALKIERVTWLEPTIKGWSVRASTGVDAPDPRGPAGSWLAELATEWSRSAQWKSIPGNPTNLEVLSITPVYWQQATPGPLLPIRQQLSAVEKPAMVSQGKEGSKDLIALLVWQDADPEKWDATKESLAYGICRTVGEARRLVRLVEGLPILGPWLARRCPVVGRRRGLFLAGIGLAVTAGLLALPVPACVTAPATLEAVQRISVQAPRDGTLSRMLVQHDQQVAVGELLFTMHDPELDRLEEELLGAHAVLEQKLVEVQKLLVRGADASRRAEWEGLRTEYETERASLLRQLDWLVRQRQRLEVRSPIDGFVEAWETELTQEGRLARRGERILEVVHRQGPWQFRAEIPQSRLDEVIAAQQEVDGGAQLPVTIVMQAFPSKPITGSMGGLGPTLDRRDGVPFGWTRVAVATEDLPLCQSGAAATISIPCGRRALGYVAFRDFLRALVRSWKLWVS